MSLLNYTLPNLWNRLTLRRTKVIQGRAADYEHRGQDCTVEAFQLEDGGYGFMFYRDGKETTRIRLSNLAVYAMHDMVAEMEKPDEP